MVSGAVGGAGEHFDPKKSVIFLRGKLLMLGNTDAAAVDDKEEKEEEEEEEEEIGGKGIS
jgi:hypothetical protein